ncbi:hypothetical protein [Streptomyces siamensis]|uniref:Uncharacterized protein n=1 Tax=Streptomyces siamensis TaxID=1274986 RepID=A0ABP9JHN2_9ACTN
MTVPCSAGTASRFGRAWRRKAPVESLMPLRLARYGVPLAETASNTTALEILADGGRTTRIRNTARTNLTQHRRH